MSAKLTIRNLFTETTVALLVLLFLYTAITKFIDHEGFVGAMLHNPLLSSYASLLRWLVPFTESVTVFLLILPKYRRPGLLVSSFVMAIFTGYVGYMLLNESELPCTCGGILEQMNWHQHFWFNLFFTIISLASYHLYPKRFVATNRRSRIPANNSRQQLIN